MRHMISVCLAAYVLTVGDLSAAQPASSSASVTDAMQAEASEDGDAFSHVALGWHVERRCGLLEPEDRTALAGDFARAKALLILKWSQALNDRALAAEVFAAVEDEAAGQVDEQPYVACTDKARGAVADARGQVRSLLERIPAS